MSLASLLTRRSIKVIIQAIMVRRQPYTIAYAEVVTEHFRAIEPKYHSLIRQTIDEQLRFEPGRETRNRKPLRRPIRLEADWELRFGPDNRFRVLYKIDSESHRVGIRAIGVKARDRLFIGGKAVDL